MFNNFTAYSQCLTLAFETGPLVGESNELATVPPRQSSTSLKVSGFRLKLYCCSNGLKALASERWTDWAAFKTHTFKFFIRFSISLQNAEIFFNQKLQRIFFHLQPPPSNLFEAQTRNRNYRKWFGRCLVGWLLKRKFCGLKCLATLQIEEATMVLWSPILFWSG